MGLVDRAKNIIVSPKTEWPVIAGENPDTGALFMQYVLPMALIPAVASFIGYGFVGFHYLSGVSWGIAYAVISLITTVAAVFLTALVVDLLAPSFASEKNFGRSLQLVVYSYTPGWVGGILTIVPVIGWLGSLFGLYGLYLMYLGLPVLKQTPQDKTLVYMIIAAVVLAVVYAVFTGIIMSVVFAIFGLSVLGAAL